MVLEQEWHAKAVVRMWTRFQISILTPLEAYGSLSPAPHALP